MFLGSPGGLGSAADWTIDGASEARVRNAGAAGDLNGDGHADFCAVGWADYGTGFVGQIGVWYGPVDLSAPGSFARPDWRALGVPFGTFGGARTGLGLALGEDFDGDGRADLALGNAGAAGGAGEVQLFLGASGGLAAEPDLVLRGAPGQGLGALLEGGDFDEDGRADLVVGSSGGLPGGFAGRLDLHRGTPEGLRRRADWSYSADVGWQLAWLDSFRTSGGRGLLATVQTPDGDEAALLCFRRDSGAPAASFASPPTLAPEPALRFARPPDGGARASSGLYAPPVVANAGDVNADGLEDFLVGFSQHTTGRRAFGSAYLFLAPERRARHLAPPPSYPFDRERDGFATSLAGAGDVNGDGYDDVLVGAAQVRGGGVVFLHYGGADPAAAGPTWEGAPPEQRFGAAVAIVGDVNGDGYDEVAIGAPGFDAGAEGRGRVFVHYGSPAGPSRAPNFAWSAGPGSSGTGGSIAGPGDVNGDGYDDLLVGGTASAQGRGSCTLLLGSPSGLTTAGAHTWSGERLGYGEVVAGAGDVNGDGRADVLLGHPNLTTAVHREGRVELYLGRSDGPVEDTAFWEAGGRQPGERFGAALASAGDGDGDGYGDVAVGAPRYDGRRGVDAGRVAIWRGAPAGLSPEPAAELQGIEAGERFGSQLAAGDFDGDALDDLLVGVPGLSAFVGATWEPGAGGWRYVHSDGRRYRIAPQVFLAAGGGHAGTALAVLGDRDGDGRDEHLVGCPLATRSYPAEGQLLLLDGHTGEGAPAQLWIGRGGAPNLALGSALDAGGDVNGDGIADVVVGGEPESGRVWFLSGATLR